MKMQETIAIFDLDKTLLPFDCDQQWGLHLQRLGWTGVDFPSRQEAFFQQYDAGTLDIHEYQAFALEATIQAGPERATAELYRFAQEVVRPAISPGVYELLDAHREQGHRLLVITATNHFVSRAVVDLFNIDALLAINLQVDETGWFNGQIKGIPSFREGKVARLQEWLQQQQLELDRVRTWFYSDSLNDLPLLNAVDHPVATNPSPGLQRHAENQRWPILRLY